MKENDMFADIVIILARRRLDLVTLQVVNKSNVKGIKIGYLTRPVRSFNANYENKKKSREEYYLLRVSLQYKVLLTTGSC